VTGDVGKTGWFQRVSKSSGGKENAKLKAYSQTGFTKDSQATQ